MYDSVVSYDLETTGFSHTKDCVIEIAAHKLNVQTGEISMYNNLVKAKKKIPSKITSITGISDLMLRKKGIKLENAISDFYHFANTFDDRTLIVGHNIIAFDNKFVNRVLCDLSLHRIDSKHTWDTLLQFRSDLLSVRARTFRATQKQMIKRKTKQRTNLAEAVKHYNIVKSGSYHRAAIDSLYSMSIFNKQLYKSKYVILAKKQHSKQ